ncbi:MAG: hypothetical protein WC408_01290 [Candidatus Micrarchaeia archaeon]
MEKPAVRINTYRDVVQKSNRIQFDEMKGLVANCWKKSSKRKKTGFSLFPALGII